MKSCISRYLLLLLILISFGSCTKELSKENGGIKQVLNGDFYATIDGNQWNADSLQLASLSNNGFSIAGLSKTGEQITMLTPALAKGTYTLDVLSNSFAIYSNLLVNVNAIYISNSGATAGTITITTIDSVKHLVSGTFQFTLTNPTDNSQKSITGGVFNNVPFSVDTSGGTLPVVTDTLQALVDGNQFNSGQVVVSNLSGGTLYIAGISYQGVQDIALAMPSAVTPGTYDMDFATGIYYGVYNPNSTTTLLSQMNGTLTVISNNTTTRRIIGNFNFIASPLSGASLSTITAGYFSVSY
jgi:Family of unknown function (DUF6252)